MDLMEETWDCLVCAKLCVFVGTLGCHLVGTALKEGIASECTLESEEVLIYELITTDNRMTTKFKY